jgi:hypothetical protein
MTIPQTREPAAIIRSRVYYFGDIFRTIEAALDPLAKKPYGNRAVRMFGKKKLAWFPKIAVLKDEALQPQTEKIEWINMVSSDGSEVQQLFDEKAAPASDPVSDDLSIERAVFAKLSTDQSYTFLGVFKKLPTTGINNTQVYRHVSVDLSIDEWTQAGKDEE